MILDSVMLRFRDITANDTIQEHLDIISAFGYCWWGWWRKDSEPAWHDALADLDSLLQNHSLDIGLFDRSEPSRFFRATANACRWSAAGRTRSPEPEKTPEYYRNEDKVAAWFRLTGIESISQRDFEGLFATVPVGHLTFFPVRSRTQTPLIDTAFVPTIETTMSGNAIMHLSDIHCGEDFRFKPSLVPPASLLDILLRDAQRLSREGVRIGLIVVSGDLTTKADPKPLSQNDPVYGTSALELLQQLARGLSLSEDHVVIVPGNHDIPLKDFAPTDYSHENGFKQFLTFFYGRRVLEFMQLWRCHMTEVDGLTLEILTLNSAKLRDKALRNYGYVRWATYDDFMTCVGRRSENTIRIAVLHHHLIPAPRQEEFDANYPDASISVTIDTGSVIEGLQLHDFRLALHGHQHVPAITTISRARRNNGPDAVGLDSRLHLVASGSAGAVQGRSRLINGWHRIQSLQRPCG